jgi:aryl-alcohol dehydrogenase (NADP+)
MAGGMLSGKHDRTKPPTEGTRFTAPSYAGALYRQRYWQDQVFDAVDAIKAAADEAGLSMPTMAVAWVLAQPGITSPLVGASRPEQLDATLKAVETTLAAELLAKLDELTLEFRRGDTPR